jgi:hypothetical protein
MRLLRLIVVIGVVCVAATADQVTMNNADRLTGKVVTADEKIVIIKTAYTGEVKLDRTMVSRIQTDETLNVTVKGAGTVKAKIDESATAANRKAGQSPAERFLGRFHHLCACKRQREFKDYQHRDGGVRHAGGRQEQNDPEFCSIVLDTEHERAVRPNGKQSKRRISHRP